jgi:hypothetical protein
VVSLMGRGVVVTTVHVAGSRTRLSSEAREEGVRRIESGEASAVCFTPGGTGQAVLASASDVLLVDEAALQAIDRDVLQRVQGMETRGDPATAMLDLQWRLNLNGHSVLALEGPVTPRESVTVRDEERRVGAILRTLNTLPGEELRGRLTMVAELYLVSCALADAAVDTTALDLQRSPGNDDVGTLTVPAAGVAAALGLDSALDGVTEAGFARMKVQRMRRVPDRALAPLVEPALAHLLGVRDDTHRERLAALLDVTGVRTTLAQPIRVLVVATDDGPTGARADQLVAALGPSADVRRVRVSASASSQDSAGEPSLSSQASWADVIVLGAVTFADVPGAARTDATIVVDLAAVDLVAWLVQGPGSGALEELMTRADLVLAADPRQRDLLLGALAGQMRVNAAVYDEDPSLLSLVRTDPDGAALVDFCRRPVRAADVRLPPLVRPGKQGDLQLALKYLKQGGPRELARRVGGRLHRRKRLTTGGAR